MTGPIHPVILCGGSGSRLWPLSRKSYPKQFSPLLGQQSLFQETLGRLSGPGFAAPLVVTNVAFRFIAAQQLVEVGQQADRIMIEPQGRNTAPAILAAALSLADTPDDLMLIAPSDHKIRDIEAFHAAIEIGAAAARDGRIVTFGVRPDRPETGYGYLETAEPSAEISDLVRFVEKPAREQAAEMLTSGRFLWNAGIFLFSIGTILSAFRTHAPQLIPPVQAALDTGREDLDFFRLGEDAFATAEDISIDYAVMEKSDNLSVVPLAALWNDLGSWDTVWRESGPDDDGVVTTGAALGIGCKDSLLRSEQAGLQLVGIGLSNTIAVAMPDAVLVADMAYAQDVKDAVAALKQQGSPQAVEFPRFHRPWGWYESLSHGDRFQVKRIMVHPGAQLSLQSHVHRAEHWVVVEGTATVTVGEETRLLCENQSVYIPLGARHRLANPGKLPLLLIEVQSGSYLGEDDIVRYEDDYARI